MSGALAAWDAAAPAEATAQLTTVLDIPSWVATLVAARPFGDSATLVQLAERTPWTDAELRSAVAGRPRLGGSIPASNPFSAGEQLSVNADRERAESIAALTVDYEQRFGMIFLIRAAGRSSADVLAELIRRLGNDSDTELAEVSRELREITLLRLTDRFAVVA
ncbi:OHCU decarboxylase [Microbacteriaceae bacterium VKM Ac-2855]|nr:OHCU decarboxylase [Microbacteriaceae bacterium VKM Ac-2855]